MEAIIILKNEANNHRLMEVDIDILSKDQQLFEDVYDIITIELRKNEETIPCKQIKQQLHDCALAIIPISYHWPRHLYDRNDKHSRIHL
jgi:hypothetical protein